MKTIAQRELRNQIGRVLREVEAGERVRITVNGRPVADLVPIGQTRRTFVPREEVLKMIREAPLDANFAADVAAVTGGTIDELWPKA
jgi:prevent-host-death family protein